MTKFFLCLVPLDAKGCDMRGVYHGIGRTFYQASNKAGAIMTVEAVDVEAAKREVRAVFPTAEFME